MRSNSVRTASTFTRDAGVLQRDQADAQGALDEWTSIRRRSLAEERRQRRVVKREALDDDPIALETDRLVQWDDVGFHSAGR